MGNGKWESIYISSTLLRKYKETCVVSMHEWIYVYMYLSM